MNGNKILRITTTTTIASAAAYGSFGHIVTLVEAHGQHGLAAYLYPVAIDALMILSSVTLTTSKGVNRMTKFWARVGMTFGLACSLAANALSQDLANTLNAVIAVIPAVTLMITVEMLLHSVKGVRAGQRSAARSGKVTKLRSVA